MPNPHALRLTVTLSLAALLALGLGQPPASGTDETAGSEAAADPYALDPRDRPADEHRVVLRSGATIEGQLLESNPQSIRVRAAGAELTFQRSEIVRLTELEPLAERYRRRMEALSVTDTEGRLAIAGWLRDNEAYRTARREAQAIVEHDPFNARAVDLRRWLDAQIALLDAAEQRTAEPQDPAETDDREQIADTESDPSEPVRRAAPNDFPLLTPEEVNRIKVYEVDLENPPRMVIPHETIERLIDRYGSSDLVPRGEGRGSIYRWPEADVLALMFDLRARELYPEVRVLDQPEAIRQFRDEVHAKWLINNCGAASCHGGQQAGRLWLSNERVNSDRTVYTNLLILDQFTLDDGTPLINFDEPERSPLLHMGLPETRSDFPHPPTRPRAGRRGWRPNFRDTEDPAFRRAVEWMDAMLHPRPDYGIAYEPPVPEGASRRAPDGQRRAR